MAMNSVILHRIRVIESLVFKALRNDQSRFRRELLRIRQLPPEQQDETGIRKSLSRLETNVRSSVKKRFLRQQNLPKLSFPEQLPIVARKDDIIETIAKNRVIIVSGETGSGKTTQIPKLCLAAGRGIDGKIGCTQPRRIAAMTVSQRIAEELGEEVGQSVGYKIRFTDRTSPNAYIKIMTDGILLAEAQTDPRLSEYDTIIVDEAHERSLNIDFVLGLLKTLLKQRNDLKLIITSATIDTEKFSKAFDHAPIVEVSGRMYPVEVRYDPPDTSDADEPTYVETAVKAVEKLLQESPYGGDILVFMPTEQDIRETCDLIDGRDFTGIHVLPLYARLPAPDQLKVFAPMSGRKIIVATNVAETSVTIPGIQYVIDTGLARISQYVPRSRTTALPVVPISKSSADQRKGRCGRVQNGVCIRLYTEDDYESRPMFTLPEILRSNLAEVILRMIALNLGNVSEFPFVDRPLDKSIQDGFDILIELGAIITDQPNRQVMLTELGKIMAQIPLDPRLSRMIIEAQNRGCLAEILIIASALSIQDPRERPADHQADADRMHAIFHDPESDFITLLNIWNKFHETVQDTKSLNKLKRFCKAHYLSFRRMREWRDIHAQIAAIIEEEKTGMGDELKVASNPPVSSQPSSALNTYAAIHQSILSGFLSNIAVKKEKNIFKASKDREVMIFPGSVLFKNPGNWIVAAEMVETSRLFARTVANIDVNWLEALGKNLCKSSYSHPHWERNRGEVVASEQVTLFGLVIVSDRPVSYGRINPAEASDIFIRSALVEGDLKKPFAFMTYNRRRIEEVQDMENRLRRRDILVSDEDMAEFYKKRLPSGVYDVRTLQRLIRRKGDDSFLRMSEQDIIQYVPDETELSQYPDRIQIGDAELPCVYQFEPGKSDDGVTVKVSSAIAGSVSPEPLDWLVPGLFKEKITALIKLLPKEYRKKLVPVSATAEIIAKEIPKEPTSLITALGKFIYRRFGVDIPASAWNTEALPDYLKMRISVIDSDGREIAAGRNRRILNSDFGRQKTESDLLKSAKTTWERIGIVQWDFGDLPERITLEGKDGSRLLVYPGLKPNETSVELRLFLNHSESLASHQSGVARLFEIHLANDLKHLKKTLSLPEEMKRQAACIGGAKNFENRLYESIIRELFAKNIRTQSEFYAHAEMAAKTLLPNGTQKIQHAAGVLKACYEAHSHLANLEKTVRSNPAALAFLNRLKSELARLVPDNFMDLYDSERRIHLPRYIKAITIRADRGLVNIEKDQARSIELAVHTENLNRMVKELSTAASEEKRAAIEEYFWMIEEYKVSLFAQELKTAIPISDKRLAQKQKEIERMI